MAISFPNAPSSSWHSHEIERSSSLQVIMQAVTCIAVPLFIIIGTLIYLAMNHTTKKIYSKNQNLLAKRMSSTYFYQVDTQKLTHRLNLQNITLKELGITRCADLINYFGYNSEISILDLRNFDITDQNIEKLSRSFPFLNRLFLGGPEICVSSFSKMPLLTSLEISDCMIDLAFTKSLQQLKNLDLSCCDVTAGLSSLQYLKQLTSLTLVSCYGITDLSFLQKMQQLRTLSFSRCVDINDLSMVQNLKHLTNLNISYCCQINDLNFLLNLKELKTLRLEGNKQIVDFNVLKCLIQLVNLDLSGCKQITDFRFLESLPSLKIVKLSGCEIDLKKLRLSPKINVYLK